MGKKIVKILCKGLTFFFHTSLKTFPQTAISALVPLVLVYYTIPAEPATMKRPMHQQRKNSGIVSKPLSKEWTENFHSLRPEKKLLKNIPVTKRASGSVSDVSVDVMDY